MQQRHLPLGRVDVHVDVAPGNLQRQVDEGLSPLGERVGVYALDGPADRGALDESVVDEEEEGRGGLGHGVGRVGDETGGAVGEGEPRLPLPLLVRLTFRLSSLLGLGGGHARHHLLEETRSIITIIIRDRLALIRTFLEPSPLFFPFVLGFDALHGPQARQVDRVDVPLPRPQRQQLPHHGVPEDVSHDVLGRGGAQLLELVLVVVSVLTSLLALCIARAILCRLSSLPAQPLSPLREPPHAGNAARVQVRGTAPPEALPLPSPRSPA